MTTFENQLRKNISKAIARVKRDATVQMSVANLCQITATPPVGLSGEPDSPSAYRELFQRVVISTPAYARFVGMR